MTVQRTEASSLRVDSALRVAVERFGMIICDSVWIISPVDTSLFVRHLTMSSEKIDSSRRTQTENIASTQSDTIDDIKLPPLMVPSKKGVKQGFAPTWLIVVLIFVAIFYAWYCYVKKK